MAIIDHTVSMTGRLSSTITLGNYINASIIMAGSLDGTIVGQNLFNAEPISISGEGFVIASSQNLINLSVFIEGTLDAHFNAISCVTCRDVYVDFEGETIYSKGCTGMANMNQPLTRHRGDTYPIDAVLAVKGNYDISAFTSIIMSTKIGTTIYAIPATILDASQGLVEFPISDLAVIKSGIGVYDIQGDNGKIYTFQSGTFTLVDDVTV